MLEVVDAALNWAAAKSSLLTGTAALIGAWVAVRGLQKWKEETVGKRRMELAEELLVGFYRAQDAISWARFDSTFAGEGSSRQLREGEAPDLQNELDQYHVVVERMRAENELFSRLRAQRYVARVHFGPSCEHLFVTLNTFQAELMSASSALIRERKAGRKPSEKYLEKIWAGRSDPDEFGERLVEWIMQAEEALGGRVARLSPMRAKPIWRRWLSRETRRRRAQD